MDIENQTQTRITWKELKKLCQIDVAKFNPFSKKKNPVAISAESMYVSISDLKYILHLVFSSFLRQRNG